MAKNANNLYLSLLAFSFGIGIATFKSLPMPTVIWLLSLSMLCALFYRRTTGKQEAKFWLAVSLTLVFFVFGVLRTNFVTGSFGQSSLENQVGNKVTLTGQVIKEPEQTASSLKLTVKSGSTKIIVTTDRYSDVKYGDQILVSGSLEKPKSFVTDLGREFDYPNYLLARGVEFQIPFATVLIEERGKGNTIIATLLEIKQAFIRNINSYLVEPNSGLASGLLLGVKAGLGKVLEADFRTTGVIHIVVLSGYNIMLIVTFVLYVLGSFLPKTAKILIGIFAIAGFALMVGLSATVVRACLMAGLLLLAEATSRRYLVLRALLLAGAVMLLINPYLLIYDIGFQLSFLATLGLILLSPILEQFLIKVPNWFGMRLFITATLSTQIMVLPLILYYTGQLSVLAVLVNVLVLPMVPIAMLLTFLTGFCGFIWPTLTSIIALPAYLSLSYIIEVVRYFASLPFASFAVSDFSLWWLLPFYFGLSIYLYFNFSTEELVTPSLIQGRVNLKTTNNESTINFSDWTIIEEPTEETSKEKTKVVTSSKEETTNELPIFFR